MDDDIEEEINALSGPDLFRELLRLLPLVTVEDYCKNGLWLDDVMRLDIQILAAHRVEAGAPDPPRLADALAVPEVGALPKAMSVPSMPTVVRPLGPTVVRPLTVPPATAVAPPAAATAVAVAAAAGTAPAGVPSLLHQGTEPKAPVQAPPMGLAAAVAPAGGGAVGATASAGPGSAVAELRQIAVFVSKWGLDPARTKSVLAQLTPVRRRFVMSTFKGAAGENGEKPVAKLEQYVAQCEQTNAWAAADAAAVALSTIAPPVSKAQALAAAPTLIRGATPAAVGHALLAGVKRGLEQVRGVAVMPPAVKPRPAVVLPNTQAWSPTAIRPPAIRPAAATWAT